MLVDLGLVEQRYKAVSEVLVDGATVTEVARRLGVSRQTVHTWLHRYGNGGMADLADRSSRPARCPHQTPAELEVAVITLRRAHPAWGPRRVWWTRPRRVDPAVALDDLPDLGPQRDDRPAAPPATPGGLPPLGAVPVDGVVADGRDGPRKLTDGTELSVVTGIDDHSRFCVSAMLVPEATAGPVCDALVAGVRAHGVPDAILTDNGKVFTGRFGLAKTEVLFDRICQENGVRHLLTAPYSPTTTGKVERLHKTMRAEFFNAATCATIEELQAAVDAWVVHYNTERPHQGIGDVAPAQRFALAQPGPPEVVTAHSMTKGLPARLAPAVPPATRVVDQHGGISLARHRYTVGTWLAGETVDVVCGDDLLEVFHRGVLIVSHVARHETGARIVKRKPVNPPPRRRIRLRRGDTTPSVTRLVEAGGSVSFAGASYKVGREYARRSVQVGVVDGRVEITLDGFTIRTHPICHDRAKEHGALANPTGRPRRPKPAA